MMELNFAALAIIVIYMFPTVVAGFRQHANTGSILVVNLFLGWTLIAWVLCLAWAVGANTKADR